jgi:hypothetical protein
MQDEFESAHRQRRERQRERAMVKSSRRPAAGKRREPKSERYAGLVEFHARLLLALRDGDSEAKAALLASGADRLPD